MKSVVDWLLARRYRLILVAAVLAPAPLLQVVSAALIALETAWSGVARGATAAVIAAAGVSLLAVAAHASVGLVDLFAGASLASGLFLGAILRSQGGLRLAFQATVLLGVLVVLGLTFIGPGPAKLFAPVLDRFVAEVAPKTLTSEQLDRVHEAAPLLLGVLAAGALTQLLGALFLACWWLAYAGDNGRFGSEFRELKLGLVVGLPATILVVIRLVLPAALVQNLTPLVLIGFLFQGLSVLHAWAHAKRWNSGLVVPVYVLLILPLIGIIVPAFLVLISPLVVLVILALSGAGLVDNWFDLRAPLRG